MLKSKALGSIPGQADDGQKRLGLQYALRSPGHPEDKTLQPGGCWAVLGECGALPMEEVPHCILSLLSSPQQQHSPTSCLMEMSMELA